jgi:hypothetical protein
MRSDDVANQIVEPIHSSTLRSSESIKPESLLVAVRRL